MPIDDVSIQTFSPNEYHDPDLALCYCTGAFIRDGITTVVIRKVLSTVWLNTFCAVKHMTMLPRSHGTLTVIFHVRFQCLLRTDQDRFASEWIVMSRIRDLYSHIVTQMVQILFQNIRPLVTKRPTATQLGTTAWCITPTSSFTYQVGIWEPGAWMPSHECTMWLSSAEYVVDLQLTYVPLFPTELPYSELCSVINVTSLSELTYNSDGDNSVHRYHQSLYFSGIVSIYL